MTFGISVVVLVLVLAWVILQGRHKLKGGL
jgi:hypothetical protein